MANLSTDLVINVRLDERERQAIREWMDNALAAMAMIAAKAPCTHEERAMLTAFLKAMKAAGEVLWELAESRGEERT